MSSNDNLPQTFNNKDAARYVGVSPDMLRLSRHTGFLFKGVPAPKFLKIGSAVRYRRDELDRWLSSHIEYASNAEVASLVACGEKRDD